MLIQFKVCGKKWYIDADSISQLRHVSKTLKNTVWVFFSGVSTNVLLDQEWCMKVPTSFVIFTNVLILYLESHQGITISDDSTH